MELSASILYSKQSLRRCRTPRMSGAPPTFHFRHFIQIAPLHAVVRRCRDNEPAQIEAYSVWRNLRILSQTRPKVIELCKPVRRLQIIKELRIHSIRLDLTFGYRLDYAFGQGIEPSKIAARLAAAVCGKCTDPDEQGWLLDLLWIRMARTRKGSKSSHRSPEETVLPAPMT